MKVLFYVDSAVAFGNSVAAAEMLRRKLDAEIVMMIVDSSKYLNASTEAYTVFDYSNLFRPETGFVSVWPKQEPSAKRRSLGGVLGVLRAIRNGIRRVLRTTRRAVRPFRRQVRRRVNWIRGLVHWRAFGRSRDFRRRLANWIYRLIRWGTFDRVPASFRFGDYLRLTALIVSLPLLMVCRILVQTMHRIVTGLRDLGRNLPLQAVETVNIQLKPSLLMLVCYRSIARFLDHLEPNLIVLAEGNVETLSAIFIGQGRRRGIPTIIVPFTLPNPSEPALFYKDSPAHRATGLAARLLCRLWPKWRFEFEGVELVRLPAPAALVAEFLGVSSPAPWILNRSDAAAIALDSQAQCDEYLRLGFPRTQLHVVGDAHGEILYNARCNKERLSASLFKAHGFDVKKPLVLCGFPPDQFDSYNATDFEFADYPALVSAWTSVFRELKDHANFLVRPHPRTSSSQIELLRSHGVEVSTEATAELIALCDVYLASISATIRWAIACGIPVINYDTYRYRYDDFGSAAGVFNVEELKEFRELLRRLLTDPEFASEARRRQQTSMEYWGLSDGKTSDRLAALALKVVGATEPAACSATSRS